ncbi:uncharacterized protein [Dermacentor albipictus]|uniref:uncharacterized protein isoform X4 n=1 Tax=Dermacentor albipictus TaxID=60249 RepID=UPI0038FBE8DD
MRSLMCQQTNLCDHFRQYSLQSLHCRSTLGSCKHCDSIGLEKGDMPDVRLSSCVICRQSIAVETLALSNPRNGTLQELPALCTQTPTQPCDMLACLHILNEWLVAIGVEVKEVAFRKIAIADRQILLRGGNFNYEDVRGATLALHILLCRHRCVCAVDLKGISEEDMLIDQAILHSAADSANLTSFTFAVCHPQSSCMASIRRLLENTTTLTDLAITHWALHDIAFSVKQIIGALAANRTLTSLTLRDLNLSPLEKEKLAELLNSSSRLQYVAFLDCKTSLEEASTSQEPRPHVHALVKALEKTKSLEQLVLNWSFSLQEIRYLARAVRGKMLELHLLKLSLDQPEPFLRTLDGAPGSCKVVFGECTFPEGPFLPMIHTMQEVPAEQPLCFYTIYNISLNSLCRVVAGDGGDHIRSLELRPCANLCPEMRRDLALYLASTRRLRRLQLEIENAPELLAAVFHGLSQNSSIEDLLIYAGCNIDEKSVELFSGWLSTNRRLHSLEVSYSYRGKEPLAQALAESMHRNYALTSIALGAAERPHYDHLCNLTWRNLGLLHCAAGFILGCTQMRAAKAYGLLARHPLLLETVQKSGSLSSSEIKARFRTAETLRRREFWRHTGIVRGELVCNQTQCDGEGELREAPLQLDQLGPYMLDHICSFLVLADVASEHGELQGWPGQFPG